MANDVPQMFDWDATTNTPGDRWSRAELNHAVVEFQAGTEYMVRAPPPYCLVFLVDVSHSAIQSGTPPEIGIGFILLKTMQEWLPRRAALS
jgi:protein transport protein SEC24